MMYKLHNVGVVVLRSFFINHGLELDLVCLVIIASSMKLSC